MWKDLPVQWKTVFNEVWKAMKNNSVPAGAAVFSSNGELLAAGRNRYGEQDVLNPYTAHACINVLNSIDMRRIENKDDLILFTSMEPCHMCLGAISISGIRYICSASRDLYYGMTHYIYDDPMIRANKIKHKVEGGDIEFFQLVLQSYFEIGQVAVKKDSSALECYRRTNEDAMEIAEKLYLRRAFQQLSIKDAPCSEIYDMIMKLKAENIT